MLLGRLSPSRFIFSLLNETFIAQVCGLKNNECCCFREACINHKPGEAMHEIKKITSVLVKAIWAHPGGGAGVMDTGVPTVGSRGTNNIICIFRGHPCLSGIISFCLCAGLSLKHTEPYSSAASCEHCLVYFQTPASLGCVTYLSAPAIFLNTLALNYGYASCNY